MHSRGATALMGRTLPAGVRFVQHTQPHKAQHLADLPPETTSDKVAILYATAAPARLGAEPEQAITSWLRVQTTAWYVGVAASQAQLCLKV